MSHRINARPHPGPLPQGEGETFSSSGDDQSVIFHSTASDRSQEPLAPFLSPTAGEGGRRPGEGVSRGSRAQGAIKVRRGLSSMQRISRKKILRVETPELRENIERPTSNIERRSERGLALPFDVRRSMFDVPLSSRKRVRANQTPDCKTLIGENRAKRFPSRAGGRYAAVSPT